MDSMKYGYMTETNNRVRVGVKRGRILPDFRSVLYI